ncbi:MAG: lysylphosphatidylglycerol synthase transmembrane domain-containing protein [Candidatus Cloacimonadota bacterium]|nr:lysylphosphatidylglycerol synthase transmembrane domain-containing protein [Candidatus Cloacimonadota bacterium]
MKLLANKFRKIYPIFQILISVCLLIFIFRKFHISLIGNLAEMFAPFWLIMSFILAIFVIPFLAAWRWKILLHFSQITEKFTQLLKINFISIFWGIILPSADGFAAIRLYLIEKRHKQNPGKAGCTIIAEKIFGFLLLCIIGIAFSFSLEKTKEITVSRIILTAIIFILIFLFLIFSSKSWQSKFSIGLKKIKFFRKPISYLLSLHNSFVRIPTGKILIHVLPIIFIFQVCTILSVYFIFRSFGVNLPFTTHLALVPIIQIISLIPVTISGFGIREGAFVFFYRTIGISPSIAFSVSIINFLILTGVPAIIGGMWSISSQIRKKDVMKNA